jgi:NADPH-dependent F420 reductase
MSEEIIAVIGGTGNLGAALARKLAIAGRHVIIGSRAAESAEKAAAELGHGVTVPFAAQEATLASIKPFIEGKIVVDTTVPLMPPKVMRVQLPAEGSAAQRAQMLLGEGANLVSGFHNVAAHKLAKDENVACDVLIFGDDKSARAKIVELANLAGMRGIHGGVLANSAAAEAMTSVLIFINKTYQVDGAGVTISGKLIGL